MLLMVTGCGGGSSEEGSTSSTSTTPVAAPAPVSPAPPSAPAASGAEIGTYYFPGWHIEPLLGNVDPWLTIRSYPDRKPLLGYYDDESRVIVQQHADWMEKYRLSYVVFDWYYENGKIQADGPLEQYIGLTSARPKLSLLWANHGGKTTDADWIAIVAAWQDYFKRADFYKIDGENVIFVFNAQKLVDDAAAIGTTATDWISYAQDQMVEAGLPPIHFVAGVFDSDEPIIPTAKAMGFAAVSSYNAHRAYGDTEDAHTYAELDQVQRRNWPLMISRGKGLSLVLPMTVGLNHAPLGAKDDPDADVPVPTAAEFHDHLAAAKAFMDANGVKQGVVCCWNEFGEGAFIEPTVTLNYDRLSAIDNVFP